MSSTWNIIPCRLFNSVNFLWYFRILQTAMAPTFIEILSSAPKLLVACGYYMCDLTFQYCNEIIPGQEHKKQCQQCLIICDNADEWDKCVKHCPGEIYYVALSQHMPLKHLIVGYWSRLHEYLHLNPVIPRLPFMRSLIGQNSWTPRHLLKGTFLELSWNVDSTTFNVKPTHICHTFAVGILFSIAVPAHVHIQCHQYC